MKEERNIITIDEQGNISLPTDIGATAMTEWEICELFGVITPTVRAGIKAVSYTHLFQFEKELKWEHPAPGIRRQIMGYDGQLMMVKVEFEKGAVGTLHEHYHSQATYVASGKFELTIGDRKEILSTGDGYYVCLLYTSRCV